MESIWWTKVTNASHFLDLMVDSIQRGYSIILQLPENVPWYNTMQNLVSTDVSRRNSTRSYEYITDANVKCVEPGEYLFKNFCKEEKRAHYRPGIGYPEFLAKSEDIVLNDYILWIPDTDMDQVRKWYIFIEEYNKALSKNKQGCLFIIETRSDISFQEKRGIRKISYQKEIEHYDNYLFNMLVASTLKENILFKQYLAEAVSMMLPEDIELSSLCIMKGREFLDNPINVIEAIAATNVRSDGSSFNVKTSKKKLNERLWEAQIKIIFPLVEKHRNAIVHEYRRTIETLLPINAAYGEVFTEVTDVELGTLSYLVASGKVQMTYDDSCKVEKLKIARNVLAHLKTLSQKEVDEIFNL